MTRPFNELVIVELAGSVAGCYAGKLFADLGARVLKVEPAAGDPLRVEGEPLHGRMGTVFAALNTGKESVALDVHTATGRAILDRLLDRADLVIESASPGPLRPVTNPTVSSRRRASAETAANPGGQERDTETSHPHLVKLYISPFGLTGPYAGYRSTSFTDYAIGGHMYLTGEPERAPLQGAGRQPEYQAGVYSFIGAMAALWAREETGQGQTVDVSHMEGMASLHQWTTVRYTHGGFVQRRIGNRYDSTHPITIYPCQDGHVGISAANDPQTERLLAVAGLSHLLDDPRFANGVARLQHADAFDAELMPWLMAHTAAEIVTIAQTARVPVGPVPAMLELLKDEHLAARDFWVTPEGPEELRYPGPPFRLSDHPWALRRAPEAGASTRAVLREAGVSGHDALRQAGITSEAGADDIE
jgi:CoA:oxalate CoA-transferase